VRLFNKRLMKKQNALRFSLGFNPGSWARSNLTMCSVQKNYRESLYVLQLQFELRKLQTTVRFICVIFLVMGYMQISFFIHICCTEAMLHLIHPIPMKA
jgi:hypothetical protein